MTPEQVRLVQSSWEAVGKSATPDQVAELFYQHLFNTYPDLKKLFKGDMVEQGRKLIQMVTAAVNLLGKPDKLGPALSQLGTRHHDYGVHPVHYNQVGETLLWTLEQGLGSAFTDDMRDAWVQVFYVIAAAMQEAPQAHVELESKLHAMHAITQDQLNHLVTMALRRHPKLQDYSQCQLMEMRIHHMLSRPEGGETWSSIQTRDVPDEAKPVAKEISEKMKQHYYIVQQR